MDEAAWTRQLERLVQSDAGDEYFRGMETLCDLPLSGDAGYVLDMLTRMLAVETIKGECVAPPAKIRTAELIFSFEDSVEEARALLGDGPAVDRTIVKLKNAWATSRWLFPAPRPFSRELAFEIHRRMMAELGHASEIRTVNVKPLGSMRGYLGPKYIDGALDRLFRFVETHRKGGGDDVRYMFCLATVFFSAFLSIHPFSNGNGRTARMLLSVLLYRVADVPIAIVSDRTEYIKALESATDLLDLAPLLRLIARSAVHSASNARHM